MWRSDESLLGRDDGDVDGECGVRASRFWEDDGDVDGQCGVRASRFWELFGRKRVAI